MSSRNNDLQKRFRCYTKAFRVSPEENEMINRKIELSGMTKQDYIVECLLHHNVTVHGNPYVYRSLKEEIKYFTDMITKTNSLNEICLDELEILEYALKLVISMKNEKVAQFKADKDSF